ATALGWGRSGYQRASAARPAGTSLVSGHPLPRPASARLLVDRVLAVVVAVLLHLEPLTVVDLRLHRDVVAVLALGALERDLDALVVLRHQDLRSSGGERGSPSVC